MSSVPEAKEVLDLTVELYRIEHMAAEQDIIGTEAHGLLLDTDGRAALARIDAWADAHKGQ